jgi:hypothetical protein
MGHLPQHIVYVLKNSEMPPRYYTGLTCVCADNHLCCARQAVPAQGSGERRVVDLIFTSWNPLTS